MWKAFQQLSESSESSRSWHFQANEQESYLVKSLLHDLFKTSTRHHTVLYLFIFYYREYSFSWQKIEDSCKVTVDEVRLWMSRNPLVTVIMDSVFHHLFPIVSSNHTYILQLVNFQHSHQWRIAFCFSGIGTRARTFCRVATVCRSRLEEVTNLAEVRRCFCTEFQSPWMRSIRVATLVFQPTTW